MEGKKIELKPCPFCGKEATTSERENIEKMPHGWGWVGCQSCRVHIDWSHGDRGKKLAFEAWNRRSDSQENLIREFGTYEYDKKSIESGKEKPIKKDDHCCDAWRYLVMGLWSKIKYFLPAGEREDE